MPRGKGLVLLACSLVLLGSVRCGEGLREDELECERAAIHFKDCCPGASERAFSCELVEGCDTDSPPDLNAEDARCLRATSCAGLAGECLRLSSTTSSGSAGSKTVSTPSITGRAICKGQR